MAISYSVDANTIIAGIQADWRPIEIGENADGTRQLSTNWYEHTWSCRVMEAAEWLILLALRGSAFTSLTTTDETTPNSAATYATGRVMTVTGQQRGTRIERVKVTFLVDTSS